MIKLFLDGGFRVDDEILKEAVSQVDNEVGHSFRDGPMRWLSQEEIKPSIAKWLKNKKEALSLLRAACSQ